MGVHELSLCESIVRIVDGARDGRGVEAVDVVVGALRQVVPDALVSCWELVTASGPLAGAELRVTYVPARVVCRSCGLPTTLADLPVLRCGACGGVDTALTHGEELFVQSVDVCEGLGEAGGREPQRRSTGAAKGVHGNG